MYAFLGSLSLLVLIVWCTVYVCRMAIKLELVFFKNWFDAIGTMLLLPVTLLTVGNLLCAIMAVGYAWLLSLLVVIGYNLFAAWYYNKKALVWWKIIFLFIARIVVGVILPLLFLVHAFYGGRRVNSERVSSALIDLSHGVTVAAFATGICLLLKELVNGWHVELARIK